MSFESLNRKIWKMWKEGKSLKKIMDYISDYTLWSRYLSLVHTVDYLHGEKKVQFNRRQLRRVFNQTRDDFDPQEAGAAWKFLLEKAGKI